MDASMTEAELKRAVVDLALRLGWRVHETPQAKPRRPVKGQSSGYPDLTLARNGKVLWLELKQETGRTFVEQAQWGAHLPPDRWYVIRPSDLQWVTEILQ